VDLNGVIGGLRSMLERALGETATLTLALDPTMNRVNADPGQLELVLLNLVLNARDAMPQGGTVRIETCVAVVEGSHVPADPMEEAEPGNYAMLSVADTGEGMAPETLRHIFEPFFTTKGVGEGTGLGLATVYGIVKQSGGFVSVSSQVGRGTTFRIYLPMVEAPAVATTPLQQPDPVVGGSETIMVVEDEANVREFLARALRQVGYTVIEAADGAEGLRRMREHAGRVALVVSDVVMPGMSGREFADQVDAFDPTVRVLLISGYPGPEPVEEGRDPESGRAFLQKPVAPAALARSVREMLDAK
jgi:CheY-like chemotaxis protein